MRTERPQVTGDGSQAWFLSEVGRRLTALFGMPDYRRYLEHQRAHHPDRPVMNEKEFVRCELERKYAGGGARCC